MTALQLCWCQALCLQGACRGNTPCCCCCRVRRVGPHCRDRAQPSGCRATVCQASTSSESFENARHGAAASASGLSMHKLLPCRPCNSLNSSACITSKLMPVALTKTHQAWAEPHHRVQMPVRPPPYTSSSGLAKHTASLSSRQLCGVHMQPQCAHEHALYLKDMPLHPLQGMLTRGLGRLVGRTASLSSW